MNIRRTALLLLIWMTCQHAIGALVVPISHNGMAMDNGEMAAGSAMIANGSSATPSQRNVLAFPPSFSPSAEHHVSEHTSEDKSCCQFVCQCLMVHCHAVVLQSFISMAPIFRASLAVIYTDFLLFPLNNRLLRPPIFS